MKKLAWRILCVISGTILLLLCALYSMIRRSEATLLSHERRIGEDFDMLRKRHAPRQAEALFWADYAEACLDRGMRTSEFLCSKANLEKLRPLIENGRFFPYEHSKGYEEFSYWMLLVDLDRLPPGSSTPESALLDLAWAEELLLGGGAVRARSRQCVEKYALVEWNQVLSERVLTGAEARRFAGLLDYLWHRRASVREAIQAQSAMERLWVIRVLRDHSDPEGAFHRGPGWRSIFSWRIFVAQTLTSLERLAQQMEALEEIKFSERLARAEALVAQSPWSQRPPPVSSLLAWISTLYAGEEEILRQWTSLRVAMGIAWYAGEQGHFPSSLEELVPKYAPQVPSNLRCDLSENEALRIFSNPSDMVWKIRKKN